MNDLVMSLVVMSVMTMIGLRSVRALPPNERLLPQFSLLVHMVTGPALLAIMDYIFVASDVHYYFDSGGMLARLMRTDFSRWAPEVVKFTLQLPNDLAILFPEEFGGAYATSSMAGAVGILMFLLNDAQYASFVFMAGVTFLGKFASYRAVRLALPEMNTNRVAIAMMLIPSVVFWSSGVVKESFAVTGLGWLMLWTARATSVSMFASPHLLVLGLLPVVLIKPYLLFPFTLAAGTWFGLSRLKSSNAAVKPMYLIVSAVAVVALIAGLSAAFPEFSPSKFGESASQMQQYGAQTGGGSNYALGNAEATTLSGQLAFAPIALITVLIRPFIFEVRNFSMFIASIESTALLFLLVQLFRKNSLREVLSAIRKSPPLAYCFVFTMIAGLAIGLATSNFGTLSRYRIPMMPYYVVLVLVLTDKKIGVAATKEPITAFVAPRGTRGRSRPARTSAEGQAGERTQP